MQIGEKMEKRKVLLIQPDEKLTSMAREFLGRADFDVETALDGLDGMRIATGKNPNIVLIDLELDGQPEGGFKLGKSFRQDKSLKEMPLVLIITDEIRTNSKRYGAYQKIFDGFLYKPVIDTELKRVIENFTGFGEAADKVLDELDNLLDEEQDPDVKDIVRDLRSKEKDRRKKREPRGKKGAKTVGAQRAVPLPAEEKLLKKIQELESELKKRDERIESLLEQLSDMELDQSISIENLETENESLKKNITEVHEKIKSLKKSREEALELLEKTHSFLKVDV